MYNASLHKRTHLLFLPIMNHSVSLYPFKYSTSKSATKHIENKGIILIYHHVHRTFHSVLILVESVLEKKKREIKNTVASKNSSSESSLAPGSGRGQ